MYTLTFTLKQHTPIIHFQHDQDGATLRATEVKPKLDRFLIEKLALTEIKTIDGKQKEVPKVQFKNWFINEGKQHLALDYKVIIRADADLKSLSIKYSETRDGKFRPEFPCLFGNVESEDKKKVLRMAEELTLVLVFTNSSFKQIFKEHLAGFLFKTNFGFRQSKGFGSFGIEDDSFSNEALFHFTINVSNIKNEYEKYYAIFDDINLLYKTLRSGINTSNFNGIYFKSLMFLYSKSIEFEEQWDKRTIRETFYSDHELYKSVKSNRIDKSGTVHFIAKNQSNFLFRDLLGLSTEQDWMGYGKPKTDKDGNKLIKNGKIQYKPDVVSKESVTGNVERFQSPLLFKPIKKGKDIYCVYLIPASIPEKFINERFRIKSKTYPGKNFLSKPANGFDLEKFLFFCFRTVFPNDTAFDSHVQGNKNNKEAIRLKEIFRELRNIK